MEKMTERDKEYLPLLKYVMILSDKGIPVSVESVANGIAICSVEAKFEDGKWYIAKDELVKRIKLSGKRMEAVETGYYSIHGFMYYLSEYGIDMDEENICHLISICELGCKVDKYGRYIIPESEFEKRVNRFGYQK